MYAADATATARKVRTDRYAIFKGGCRYRIPISIVTLALMIPAVLGMCGTRINYDMLDYLPDSMDTVIGQDQLLEDFGKGAFSFIVVENMPDRDVATLCEKDKGRRARRDGAVVLHAGGSFHSEGDTAG